MRQRHFQPTERAMLLPDAIGLGLFAAVGVDIATAVGMPALMAVMMGVTTGVFGGVLRDVLCNEVPQAFSDHRPYRAVRLCRRLGRCGAAPGGRHRGQPPPSVRAHHGWAAGVWRCGATGSCPPGGVVNGAKP